MDTKPAPSRICPQCGSAFTPQNLRMAALKAFCSPVCQRQFHDINAARGKVLTPLVQTMRLGKRGRTDDTAYALHQVSMLADKWNAEDKQSGRRPDLVVARKRAQGWIAADLA